MFSLDIPKEPRWIELPAGVRLQMKPVDGLIAASARQSALAEVGRIAAMRKDLADAGVPAGHLPDLDDPNVREAALRIGLTAALARYGAIGWEGVGDDADNPLPFTIEGAEQLARHPAMTERLLELALAPLDRLDAEGNASASVLNGSTGPDLSIVPDAEPHATLVQSS